MAKKSKEKKQSKKKTEEKKKSKKSELKAEPNKKEEIAAKKAEEEKALQQEETQTEERSIDDLQDIEQSLEALIFASPKAISFQRICRIFKSAGIESEELKEILGSLVESYADRGLQIIKVGKSYQFRTHPKQAKLIQKLVEDKPARLSQSALEVLAIIAYKQPIVRAEIDAVRGVDSGHLLRGLLEKNLVRTDGHAEAAGRPLLYVTTPYFLEVFSLDSLDQLPSLEEFQRELGEGKEAEEGEETVIAASSVLAADPDFYDKASPLAAEPDRGDFDQIAEEEVTLPDFSTQESEEAQEQTQQGNSPMAEA